MREKCRFFHHVSHFPFFAQVEPIFARNEKLQQLLQQQPLLRALVFVALKYYTIVWAGWCLVPFVFLSFHKWWHIYTVVRFSGFILFISGNIFLAPILRAVLPRSSSTAKGKTEAAPAGAPAATAEVKKDN